MIEIGIVTTKIIIKLTWLSRTPEPVERVVPSLVTIGHVQQAIIESINWKQAHRQ